MLDPVKQDPILAPVLADLHARTPIRTWSLIVSVYGDCALPRGGELWLGTLSAILGRAGIDEGSVRTAVSRLAREGWLERHRVGRNSFYRLSPAGERPFREAERRIYGTPGEAAPGRWRILVLPAEGERADARRRLRAKGFGEIAPGTLIAPAAASDARPADPGGAQASEATQPIALSAISSAEDARRLAALAWPLERIAERYRGFLALFEPVATALAKAPPLAEVDALLLRVLLVHAFRRIVLKDPMLPRDVMPPDWPGTRARALFREAYRALSPPAERWLDRNGEARGGALPPADPPVERRLSVPAD